jgi:hypothetical protein
LATNTGFVITDAGNAAATIATPGGPYIHITQFKVGSGSNYTPSALDTNIHGTLLYTGGITNYYVVDYQTIELILFMDATVGPFDFGEIGIYLADGTLFALCSWNTLQNKIRAIGTQAGTQWRIRARLKLARAPVVCQVDVITTLQVHEVTNWELLVTPINQPGNANMVIVKDPGPAGDNVMVFKDNDNTWAINDFVRLFAGATTDAGCTIGTSVITHPQMPLGYMDLPQTVSRYLVKFPDGDIRKVLSSPGANQITFGPPKAVPLTGAFEIWEDQASACCRVAWVDTVEYNAFVTNFNPLWAAPSGSYAASNEGLNQTALPIISLPSHPSLTNWNDLHNAVIAKCKIHGVDYSGLTLIDYAYCGNNSNGFGLKSIAAQWDLLLSTVPLLVTNRNVADVAWQESTVPAGSEKHQLNPWTGTKTHTMTFTYTDDPSFQGLVNGGHQISFNGAVTTGANANWTGLKTFFSDIGNVVVGRSGTTVTGLGSPSPSIGLYQLTSTYQQVFTQSVSISGGLVTWTIQMKKVGNVVTALLTLYNQASGYYLSGVNDDLVTRAALRRASSTLVTNAYPTVTSTSDYTP